MTEDAAPQLSPDEARRQAHVVLISVGVLIFLLWHFGRVRFFRETLAPAFFPDIDPATRDLYGYYYMAAASVLTRVVLPLGIILVILRRRPRDFGYRLRGTAGLARIYLALLLVMLPVLYFASGLESFQQRYPLYDFASDSLTALLLYEAAYLFVFLSGEAFWRGFMIFGLAPRFGLYALPIMAIPYAVIHFGKPTPEVLGAILTAHVLGYLALKHRSFWFGVALHTTIGWTMDLLCLWRKGQLGALF